MARNDSGNSPSYNDKLDELRYAKEAQAQFDAAHTLFIEHGKRIDAIEAAQLDHAGKIATIGSFDAEGIQILSQLVLGDSKRRIVGLVNLHDQMNEVKQSIRTLTIVVSAVVAMLFVLTGVLLWASASI